MVLLQIVWLLPLDRVFIWRDFNEIQYISDKIDAKEFSPILIGVIGLGKNCNFMRKTKFWL